MSGGEGLSLAPLLPNLPFFPKKWYPWKKPREVPMSRKAFAMFLSLVAASWLTLGGCDTPEEVMLEEYPSRAVTDGNATEQTETPNATGQQ